MSEDDTRGFAKGDGTYIPYNQRQEELFAGLNGERLEQWSEQWESAKQFLGSTHDLGVNPLNI